MFRSLSSMLREEDGASLVEYGLLVALIALVALGAVQTLGINLSSLFTNVGTSV
jgi:pilus assembly protein Flp/PilA